MIVLHPFNDQNISSQYINWTMVFRKLANQNTRKKSNYLVCGKFFGDWDRALWLFTSGHFRLVLLFSFCWEANEEICAKKKDV